MRRAIKKYINVLIILSFCVLSFLSVILLMRTHSLNGNADIPMHLQQLREVQLAIRHHTLVYYGLNEFHGSAMMTLYPWLNMWPAGLLANFIKNRILVIYLFFIFYEFIDFLISYFSSLNINHSKEVSYLFSIFYSLSTLYLDYGFADSDYGELLTMTFLPLVIFGAISLFQRGDWLELSAGMTLIIGSHVLNTLIVVALLVIFFIINAFKFRIKIIFNLCKAILLTTFTTIAIWFPALRLMHLNWPFKTPPKDQLYGTPFRQIVGGAIKGNISYGISLFALIGAFLGAVCFLTLNRYTKQLYVISVVIVIICSAWFHWWYLAPKSLMTLQFTWRLYIIPEICLSYVAAKVIIHMVKKFPIFNILVFFGLILIAVGIQFESQQRIINLNGRAPILNREYLIKNNRPYAHDKKIQYIGTHLGKHLHSTIKTPEDFRFKGNRSYDEVFDQRYYLKTDGHYWTFSALRHYNDVNNYYVRSNQGLTGGFYNNGYNHYKFTNNKKLTNVYLPIVIYSGEPLRIMMDNHRVPYLSHQNVLYMKQIPRGTHQLSVNQRKNKSYLLCVWSLIIGLLLYIFLITFKFVKSHRQRMA